MKTLLKYKKLLKSICKETYNHLNAKLKATVKGPAYIPAQPHKRRRLLIDEASTKKDGCHVEDRQTDRHRLVVWSCLCLSWTTLDWTCGLTESVP